jgi:hypothetical protein
LIFSSGDKPHESALRDGVSPDRGEGVTRVGAIAQVDRPQRNGRQ